MKAAVCERRPLDLEAQRKGSRRMVPPELDGVDGSAGDEDADVVSQLPAKPRWTNRDVGSYIDRDRERFAREELRPFRPVVRQQPRVLHARPLAAPLLPPGGALLGIPLAGEQLPVGNDRVVGGTVEEDAAVLQQHRTVAEALDGRRVMRDEDDRPPALLEVEDLAEAFALERLVSDCEHLVEEQHVG